MCKQNPYWVCDPGVMKIITEHFAISKETKLRWMQNKHIIK